MDYQKYIKSELLILVPVLYLVGLGLKKSKLLDKWIPLTLGITGIFLSAIWVTATSSIVTVQDTAAALFTIITQGILAAGASVYTNQLYVQSHKTES
jgi:hypothetical protein